MHRQGISLLHAKLVQFFINATDSPAPHLAHGQRQRHLLRHARQQLHVVVLQPGAAQRQVLKAAPCHLQAWGNRRSHAVVHDTLNVQAPLWCVRMLCCVIREEVIIQLPSSPLDHVCSIQPGSLFKH